MWTADPGRKFQLAVHGKNEYLEFRTDKRGYRVEAIQLNKVHLMTPIMVSIPRNVFLNNDKDVCARIPISDTAHGAHISIDHML